MKLIYQIMFCCFLICGSSTIQAQFPILIKYGCNYDARADEKEYFINDATPQAQDIVEDICIAMGIDKSLFTLKSANVQNALATEIDGKKYILYSSTFLSQIERGTQSKRTVYSILAHEIGHHVEGHNFETQDMALRKLFELRADRFSGRILRNLCATEEEALLALSTLSEEAKEGYPILSARKDAVSSGWIQQDQDLQKPGRRDPCAPTIVEPQFGRKYKNINKAQDVKAIISDQSVIFQFNTNTKPGKKDYKPFIVVSPDFGIRPRIVNPILPVNGAGHQWTLDWNYFQQNLGRDLMIFPDQFGIAVFKKSQVPEAPNWLDWTLPSLSVLAGGISMIIGFDKMSDAKVPYDNVYAIFRNQNAAIYQSPSPSRNQVYNDANEEYRAGQAWRNVGIGLALGGGYFLVKQITRHSRSRIGIIYEVPGGLGIGVPLNKPATENPFFRHR
ncbi:MAG: M48 family metalloprotease [Bacteroidota bacterium]